jgi:type II secretory pathway component GspD/PulD (secretin)
MLTASCQRFTFWCNAILLIVAISRPLQAQTTTDFARLVHPDVADQIGLDDGQRAKLQTLLQQRLELGSQATAEKPADYTAIDQQIQATLTAEQWKAFQAAPPEQKLRFQFREQSWADVLQWFARQDNLTLVMDRAPSGTFTYSDNRSYTPTEAIDLLNSVLLTKNFTLLKRDRMLTVIELTNDIPIELIPRIKLEDLPSRGRFELVSVLFPLGKRPIDAVVTEVQPYLSNYGRAVPLAQSRQLLVIETAGKMQTINLLIASVPEPAVPPQPPRPEPPPVPVFAAYPLGNLDPQATLATIKKLIPSEQITVDDKTRVLSAFLIPGQQTAIQTAIAVMQKDSSESPGLESMSYKVANIDAKALEKQIIAIAPTALVSFDTVNGKVIVTAPSLDQAKVAKLLEAIGSPVTNQNMMVKSFQLLPTQSATVTLALKAMLPNSQVLSNDASGIIIVRGNDADLQLADDVVATYKTKPIESTPLLKVYPLDQTVPATWLTQVTKAFPEASLWLDAEQKQLLALTTSAEQLRLESMLPELKKLLPIKEKRTVAIYPLSPLQLQRWPLVEAATKTIIPNATISPPTTNNELIVWGSPSDQEQLQSLLDQLQQESTTEEKIRWPKVYPLKVQQPTLVLELMQKRFVDATISYAEEQLTVWADQTTQQSIAEFLTQLSTEMPSELPTRLQTYTVDQLPVTTLQTMLTDLLGKSKVIPDTTGNRLLVWATEETHVKLAEAVDQIAAMPPSAQEKVLVAYPLQHVDGTNLKTLLATALPAAVIVVDADGKQLIATATLTDQLRIKATIEQLDIPRAALDAEEIRTYAMKNNLQAATLVTTLQTMFPKLKLTADSTNNQILATGPLKEHQQLQTALDRLFSGESGETIDAKTYEIPYGDLTTLPSILAQIAPKSVISTDVANRTILVWATASQHEKIAQALDQLNQKSEGRQILQVYKVPTHRSPMIRLALAATFPGAAIGVDSNSGQIVALATKEMQARIGDAIKQLLEAPDIGMTRVAKRYDLPKKFRATLPTILTSISTTITVVTPPTDLISPLVVLATPDEHKQIVLLVQSLTESDDLDVGAVTFKVYDLGSIDPAAFSNLLSETRPQARLLSAPTAIRVIIADSEEGHQQIEKLRESLEKSYQETVGLQFKIYSVRGELMTQLTSIATSLAPTARLFPNAATEKVVVLATQGDQNKIESWITELDSKTSPPAKTDLRIYPLAGVDKTQATEVLVGALGTDVKIIPTTKATELTVQAVPDVHQKVVDTLKILTDALAKPDGRRMELFALDFNQADVTSVSTSLRAALGTSIALTPLVASNTLMVVGTEEQIEQVRKILESLQKELPDSQKRQSLVYALKFADPTAAVRVLQSLVPKAILAADVLGKKVAATGTPNEQKQIAEFITSYDTPVVNERETKIYPLQRGSGRGLSFVVQEMLPNATVYGSRDAPVLMATASAEDHEKITKIIEQYNKTSGGDETTTVITLKKAKAVSAAEAVRQIDDLIKVTTDLPTNSLIITASAERTAQVEALLKQLEANDGFVAVAKRYQLSGADPVALQRALAVSFPKATLAADAVNGDLYVTATEPEQAEIQKLVDSANQPSQRSSQVYALQYADPTAAVRVLISLLPKATLAPDLIGKKIAATATEAEHKQIAEFVKSYDQPISNVRETRIYQLKRGTGRGFGFVLQEMLPEATIFGSRETSVVMATASAEDHEKIQAMIDQYNNASGGEEKTVVIALKKATADSVAEAIEQIDEEIRVSADDEANTVVVTTSSEKIQIVESIVKQMEESVSSNVTTKGYPLKEADPTALQRALRTSFPRATISADDTNGTLYVTAMETEHAEIAQLIDATNQSLKRKPTLKTFMLQHSNAADIANSLEEAFGRRSNVGISFDENTGAVFVLGTPDDLTVADQVVQQMDVAKSPGAGRKLKAFSLSGADGDAIVESIEALFPEAYPEVNVSWDVLKEQLVVIGSTEQLALVEETLKQFAPPERDLEIFNLRNSDPNTIQTAINSLFADEPYATSPTVNKDEANSQILVRGTKEQLVMVRQLLQKMGEPLTESAEPVARGRVRTVTIQRDSELLLEQLRKVWPQVRDNPLEIVRVPNENLPPKSDTPDASNNPEKPPRGPNPDPLQEPAPNIPVPNNPATKTASGNDSPPVVVIPGDRQWTIASEDIAALDQFESLLAAGMRQPVLPAASTGNYSVYMLRHADADELQQLFTSLFRRGATNSGGSSPFTSSSLMRTTFVADTRINALVMYGGNADRTVIEELLSVLDSDELINQLQLEQPALISVENTDAQRVVDVLEDVYNNQLTSDGGRKPLTIPEGISADVATILQQINAETVGPILTLGVEPTSNSIVLRAPAELSREIHDFVQLIDQRAGEQRSRQIQVIRLRESKSSQIEDALQMLLRTPRQGRQ